MRNVAAFIATTKELLQHELEEQVIDTSISKRTLERMGHCVRRLYIAEHSSALFGRTQLKLHVLEGSLPPHKCAPNDLVSLADYRGIVSRVSATSITVLFDDIDPSIPSHHGPYTLFRLANTVTFDRYDRTLRHLAVMQESPYVGLRRAVFGLDPLPPVTVYALGSASSAIRWSNRGLNGVQQRAIQHVMAAEHVGLLHGPPGTGKTTCVAELVHQFASIGESVLAVAPSNVAVDNLVEKLAGIQDRTWSLCRIGHPARILASVLEHSLDYMAKRSEDAFLAKDIRHEMDQCLQQLAAKSKDKRAVYAELKLLRRELRQKEIGSVQKLLASTQVTLATTAGAGDRVLRGNEYDVVIIDEAGQALEVECWIAILKAKSKVVLAGDHLQLPPTVLSSKAEQGGLGITLFERLVKDNPEQAHMLQVQYRMHKSIMQWSSDVLYQGKLIADASVAGHTLQDLDTCVPITRFCSHPLVLIDTVGIPEALEEEAVTNEAWDDVSWLNHGEAVITAHVLQRLERSGVSRADIGVITPYRGQSLLLKDAIGGGGLEIGTVDGFQGREKEVVILSLVRSNDTGDVGFLKEIRRLNVAITRARRLLVVIANSSTLTSAKASTAEPRLCHFAEHCLQHSLYCSGFAYTEPNDDASDMDDVGHTPAVAPTKPVPVIPKKKRITKAARREQKKQEYAEKEVAFIESVREKINCVVLGKIDSVEFPPSLSDWDRRQIHGLCEEADVENIQHVSVGDGSQRRLIVSLRQQQPLGEEKWDQKEDVQKVEYRGVRNPDSPSPTLVFATPHSELESDIAPAPSVAQVSQPIRPKEHKKKKKSKPKPKKKTVQTQEDNMDDDALLDALIASAATCSFDNCSRGVSLVSIVCEHCKLKYCMKHGNYSIHGCYDAAKKASRFKWIESHSGHQPLSREKHAMAKSKLAKQRTAMTETRKPKQKPKQ